MTPGKKPQGGKGAEPAGPHKPPGVPREASLRSAHLQFGFPQRVKRFTFAMSELCPLFTRSRPNRGRLVTSVSGQLETLAVRRYFWVTPAKSSVLGRSPRQRAAGL